MENNIVLRQRMYVLVERHLDGINKGIQAAHAVAELIYNILSSDENNQVEKEKYLQWQNVDKTMILLNGGISRGGKKYLMNGINEVDLENIGDMERMVRDLKQHNVKFATFCEPDLNDALTAIAFLVDERVWDKEKYPDCYGLDTETFVEVFSSAWLDTQSYAKWVEKIGGPTNVWLRDMVLTKRLA